MSRKKTRDYKPVFETLLKKMGGLPKVEGFCIDFEKGAWKAIKEIFPGTRIKGCAFHFSQAIWRRVQELGLKTTYTKRGEEYRYIRSLMALPFLPHSDILLAYETLAARANSVELKALVCYIKNTWFDGPHWVPKTWSIFQHSIRTNNDVEGWHKRINGGKENVSFYVLVPELQREADIVDLNIRLVTEEQVLRDQRMRVKETQGRLHQYWDEYTNDDKPVMQLLRDCSRIYGPEND